MKSRLVFALATLLAFSAGCLSPEDPADGEDLLGSVEAALISPQVAGLSSSGVSSPLSTVDTNLATSTTVDSSVGHCMYNGHGFIKVNAGYCIGPGAKTFYGWELVTLRIDNASDADSVDLQVRHASDTNNGARTEVFTSWDGVTYAHATTFSSSTTAVTSTLRLVPPSQPAPYLRVILGKATNSTAPLRWYEVMAQSNRVLPPTNLRAQVVSWNQVNLTWTDTSVGERDFEIFMFEGGVWRSLGADPGGANQTSEPITGLAGNTTYSFKVRTRSWSFPPSGFSNVVTVTTSAPPPGRIAFVNNSRLDALAFAIDGQLRAPDQVSGNQAFFDVPAGNHPVVAALGYAFLGRTVCDREATIAVAAAQTTTINLTPFTAGETLTHCVGAATYAQGFYVDANGPHTVTMTFNANNTFSWTHDGRPQLGGTINAATTVTSGGSLAFTLSTGDRLTMNAPFGTLDLRINGFVVRLLRQTNW